jgi:hypothetical protein
MARWIRTVGSANSVQNRPISSNLLHPDGNQRSKVAHQGAFETHLKAAVFDATLRIVGFAVVGRQNLARCRGNIAPQESVAM